MPMPPLPLPAVSFEVFEAGAECPTCDQIAVGHGFHVAPHGVTLRLKLLGIHYSWVGSVWQEPIRCPKDGRVLVVWWRPVTRVTLDYRYNLTPVEVTDGKKTTARYHSDAASFGWTIEETGG
jgi:hypothetical protein